MKLTILTLSSILRCLSLPLVIGSMALCPADASDLLLYPDDQTAWTQSSEEFILGENMSANHWLVGGTLEVTPGEDGVQIVSPPRSGGPTPCLARYVPYSQEYPWLQFDISEVSNLEGFSGLTLIPGNLDAYTRGSVGTLVEGRYVTRLTPGPERPDANTFVLRMDFFGFQLMLKNLSMKRDPLPRLEAHLVDDAKEIPEIGDQMKVTVYLADKAEDVSVELLNTYLVKNLSINGGGSLQLTPEDSDEKIWSGTFTLENLDMHPVPKGKLVRAGGLLFKATILGGNFPQPLLNWNEVPWDVNR